MLILCSICVVILFIVNFTFHWFCYLFIFCLFIVIHLCCLCLWGLWLLVRFNRICMCLWCCFVIWTVISYTVTSYFCVLCHSWDFSRSGCDLLYGSLLFLCIVSLVGFFFLDRDCDFLYGSILSICVVDVVLPSGLWFLVRFPRICMCCWCCFAIRIVISCTVPSYLYVL